MLGEALKVTRSLTDLDILVCRGYRRNKVGEFLADGVRSNSSLRTLIFAGEKEKQFKSADTIAVIDSLSHNKLIFSPHLF